MKQKTTDKRPLSIRKLAESLGVSKSRVARYRQQGYSDENIIELVNAGSESGNAHTGENEDGDGDLLELKKAKINEEIEARKLTSELARLRIQKEKKELVSFDAAKDAMIKAGSIVKNSILSLESILPGILAGLSQEEILALLRPELEKVLENIKKESNFAMEALLKNEK